MRRKAFTLLELLTVIAIIGVLAGITSYVVASSMIRSRDSQRLGHMRLIGSALEQYYTDLRQYPTFLANPSGGDPIYSAKWQLGDEADTQTCSHPAAVKLLTPLYLMTVPEDPRAVFAFNQGTCVVKTSYDGQYLYFSYSSIVNGVPAETASSGDAKSPAIGYWLLAKTERSARTKEPFQLEGNYYGLSKSGATYTIPGAGITIDQSPVATQNYWLRNSHNN